MDRLRKKRTRQLLVWLTALALIISACAWYVTDYYHADAAAIAAFQPQTAAVTLRNRATAYGSGDAQTGFIFYPGGKVEHTSYEPLMHQLASMGVLCVLVEMPFNLAVLDTNAAEGIRNMYPQISSWYIGGHSLGGSMAAFYAAAHPDQFDGIVLLGAYSSKDLSDTTLWALSIYGSEDRVMNRSKYDACRANLPGNLTEIVIDGGCHAGFGLYGPQNGDGTPTIPAHEQIRLTAQAIHAFMAQGAADAQSP